MSLSEAQTHFRPANTYLNTATVGLACNAAMKALQEDLLKWQSGTVDALHYDDLIAQCRRSYASLVNSEFDRIAILSQVSVASGVAASLLRPGNEVLLAQEDFTSVLFPFLQTADRGVAVRVVPLEQIVDEIRPSTTLVALSSVQSSDGRVTNLDALAQAAKANDCLTFVDLTQSASWLVTDSTQFSITVCGAYKWLCSPRGCGFMTVQEEVADRLTPSGAGWYAGEKPWESIYEPPLRLAQSARRFDLSPAWATWVGAAPPLGLLAAVGPAAIGSHNVGLANCFRNGLGLESSNSAIVSITLPQGSPTSDQIAAAGVVVAGRAGKCRLSFHLYNTTDDVERALDVITNG